MAVRLDDRGLLAHHAEWVGRRTGRSVAGLGPEDGTALLFAADELLVDGEHVKFCEVPRVEGQDALLSLLALDFRGDVVVTSDMGAAVAALAARYRLDGRGAALDLVSPCSASGVFEPSSSFDTATLMLFQAVRWSPCLRQSWGPGTYETTSGHFRLKVPQRSIYTRPTVTVSGSSLQVVLYDDHRIELDRWSDASRVTVHPPEWSTCYLTVSSPTPYRIGTAMTLDTPVIAGPHHEIEVLPKWWSDPPPLLLTEPTTRYLYDPCPGEGPALLFERRAVRIELLDRPGQVIRRASPMSDALSLDTTDLPSGPYVLQITRQSKEVVPLRQLPPLLQRADPLPGGAWQPAATPQAPHPRSTPPAS
ncbi:hypothetical protein HDA39_005617 [Kribbella italica]|uniref:Uncharacterized protein n=1 Tax=Kribbella italica TaxID=1540520 RepID=A0A7W9JB44_9ACTN|nr:hypothetical protein [Kribbella italica]